MRKVVFVAALLGGSAGASAQEMDWRTAPAQAAIQSGLAAATDMCVDFGFTRAAAQPAAALRGKIGVHLLGSAAPKDELDRWSEVVTAERRLREAVKDPARLEHGREALAAAYVDPAAVAPARERFVDGEMAPIRAALDACRGAAAEPFIAAHYFTGQGEVAKFEDMFRALFTGTLEKMAERAAELKAKPPGAAQ